MSKITDTEIHNVVASLASQADVIKVEENAGYKYFKQDQTVFGNVVICEMLVNDL